MSFPSVQPSLDRLHADNISPNFVDRHVYARLESLKIAGQEIWQIIVNIGESIKGLLGSTARFPVKGFRWLFPSCGVAQRLHDWLPSCQHFRDSIKKVAQAFVGALSSIVLGAVNPSWNHSLQVKVGIIPAPAGP